MLPQLEEVKVGNKTEEYGDHCIVVDQGAELWFQLSSPIPACLWWGEGWGT